VTCIAEIPPKGSRGGSIIAIAPTLRQFGLNFSGFDQFGGLVSPKLSDNFQCFILAITKR
jgi:hypothetical protein